MSGGNKKSAGAKAAGASKTTAPGTPRTIAVNGVERPIAPDDEAMSLLRWLREREYLTGTKNGCEIGACGTCTVLVDGAAVRACKSAVTDVERGVVTIEGMERPDGSLHPVQQAFVDLGAIQCGFCTPGMVLGAYALLEENPEPSRLEIRKSLQRNLCRCTGYQQIVDAVEHAARVMKQAGGVEPPGCSANGPQEKK